MIMKLLCHIIRSKTGVYLKQLRFTFMISISCGRRILSSTTAGDTGSKFSKKAVGAAPDRTWRSFCIVVVYFSNIRFSKLFEKIHQFKNWV